MLLQYFSSYFPLVFLEGCCLSSSLETTSLYLDPMIWDPSVSSNKTLFSTSTLSWSCWRYSNCFFFFSSSTSLCFSPCLLSHIFHTIGLCCLLQMTQKLLLLLVPSLYFTTLFFEHFSIVLENIRENREIYDDVEEKAKSFLFCLYIVDLDTITEFLDKFNKTLNKLNKISKTQS